MQNEARKDNQSSSSSTPLPDLIARLRELAEDGKLARSNATILVHDFLSIILESITHLERLAEVEKKNRELHRLMAGRTYQFQNATAVRDDEITALKAKLAQLEAPVTDEAEEIASLKALSERMRLRSAHEAHEDTSEMLYSASNEVDDAADTIRRLSLQLKAGREARQATVYEWALRCFGSAQMTSPQQRALRLIEEAIELGQAVFCDRDQLHKLIDYIYARPPGKVEQELGGVGVCLLAMAETCKVSADECERREVERVLSKSPEHFAQRNQEKNDAGFTTLSHKANP